MTIKASVIIPTKNPGKQFHNVLNAVLSQKAPWPYEVIVIDSGSTDGTLDYCHKLAGKLRLIEILPEEFGHGKTRNYAASQSMGEFVVFLTHDALPKDESWLSNLVEATNESETIAGSFGRHIAYPNGNPFNARDLELHFDNFLSHPSIVNIDSLERYQTDIAYRQFLHFFSNNNSCIRRSVLQKIPFPDVDFAEDQIWAMKALEAGYSKRFVNDAIVFHSHDYFPFELFKRSVDESRALAKMFGYQLCPNLYQLFLQSIKTTIRDLKFAYRKKLFLTNPFWSSISPLLNFSKQLGFYVGQRLTRQNNDFLLDRMSLDRAMKQGKRKL
ncbi:glycosyltransferase family 2 protein [Almyronema epifaneia]|uniref:Glycosyltransferase family 2 protein n=1 Tax=Almyronema epifaneia S1 TaxID=2991925 RepID=A0ABW6IAR7_9CYAN